VDHQQADLVRIDILHQREQEQARAQHRDDRQLKHPMQPDQKRMIAQEALRIIRITHQLSIGRAGTAPWFGLTQASLCAFAAAAIGSRPTRPNSDKPS
jgi:hypothetical protein